MTPDDDSRAEVSAEAGSGVVAHVHGWPAMDASATKIVYRATPCPA